ncbi:MAG TPA: phage portal protein [Thermomicrobiaceae bacterium]|nr:phage portal protein [Thermomicrobiaceae bacterium]
MGIFRRILASYPATPTRDFNGDFGWNGPGGGSYELANILGRRMTHDSAMTIPAVWAAVKILSETLASLPIQMYARQADGGKRRATEHPLYDLLHDLPNPWQTAFEFKEMLQAHVVLRGNAFARIQPGPRGMVDSLIPLHPDRVQTDTDGQTILGYRYTDPAGVVHPIRYDEMFHLRGLSLDGILGVSVIAYARESFGLAHAAESFGARLFSQDATPGGVLQHPGQLSNEAAERLRHDWQMAHAGLHNAHKVAVLEEGMTFNKLSFTPEDAQFLQSRSFQVAEIARWFRIPPHLLGDLERATFSNIEQQGMDFVMYTMLPWITRWEQIISRDLISATGTYFAEFLLDNLLRGDIGTRYGAYATGRQNGWLSVNDIRRMENLNPVPGGDAYLQPLNMTPATNQPPPSNGNAESALYQVIARNGNGH